MLPCMFSVIDHRWRQKCNRNNQVAHEAEAQPSMLQAFLSYFDASVISDY